MIGAAFLAASEGASRALNGGALDQHRVTFGGALAVYRLSSEAELNARLARELPQRSSAGNTLWYNQGNLGLREDGKLGGYAEGRDVSVSETVRTEV